MNIKQLLDSRVKTSMLIQGIPDVQSPMVLPSKNPSFGDYQANGMMSAANSVGLKPRDLAEKVVSTLDLAEVADSVEIAGPGFINIGLSKKWLSGQLVLAATDSRLLINEDKDPKTVVIDYSGPNLAKEMHVGHLRSTIIGDSIARILEFKGHRVIRQNHVGDWGTQFGMLIAELEEVQREVGQDINLKDLEAFYKQSKQHFDEDPAFADKSREYVVKLQAGNPEILKLWERFKSLSLEHSKDIYTQLGVTLTDNDVRGESFYNNDLGPMVSELKESGLSVESDGAQVVFLEELADKEGNPSPVIIQKNGGGYLYATTDLAALRYRANHLKADRIMYFIDARQSLHMQQVFTLAKKAGFVSSNVALEHLAFGTMMGEDGRPFKSRSGETVKLADLLAEAKERATAILLEKNPDLKLDPEQLSEDASKIAIGAVKYADLCKTRTNDYVFNWDQMLSFEGNTAPYLQYVYARIQSIFRKSGSEKISNAISIESPFEKALAIKILQLSEIIDQVAREAMPHTLCTYLYDLATIFNSFYENCPVLKDGVNKEVRDSRLLLCHLTANTMKTGLEFLGIEVLNRM